MSKCEANILSVQQPWAWLIVHRWKNIENRKWKTHFRGNVLIHASKTFDHEGYKWVCENFPIIPMPSVDQFQRGGIVGMTRIWDCVRNAQSPWAAKDQWHFKLIDSTVLPFKACPGQLKIFKGEFDVNYFIKLDWSA